MHELVMKIYGVEKYVDNFLAKAPTLEKLEERLRQLFNNYEELGVKISTKKFRECTKIRLGDNNKFRGRKNISGSRPGKTTVDIGFPTFQ